VQGYKCLLPCMSAVSVTAPSSISDWNSGKNFQSSEQCWIPDFPD
jgi:hypothetical protein